MNPTVAELRQRMMRDATEGKTVDCPCCRRTVRLYKRTINKTTARCLIEAVRMADETGNDVVDVREVNSRTRDVIGKAVTDTTADFAKLRWWRLIHEVKNTDPRHRSSGLWIVDNRARRFVRGELQLASRAHVLLGEVVGFSDDLMTIVDALGEPFDYADLMRRSGFSANLDRTSAQLALDMGGLRHG